MGTAIRTLQHRWVLPDNVSVAAVQSVIVPLIKLGVQCNGLPGRELLLNFPNRATYDLIVPFLRQTEALML